jgi:hypothetical protein
MSPIYESIGFDAERTSAGVFANMSKLDRKIKLRWIVPGVDNPEEYVMGFLFILVFTDVALCCKEWDRRDRFNSGYGFGLRIRPMSRYPTRAIW